jgi:hypothetical protein
MKVILAVAGWMLLQPHPKLPDRAIKCDNKLIAITNTVKVSKKRFFWAPYEFYVRVDRKVSKKTFNKLVQNKECIK